MGYHRFGKVPTKQVFDAYWGWKNRRAQNLRCGDAKVKLSPKRIGVYAEKGMTCVRCGRKGEYFAAEISNNAATRKWLRHKDNISIDPPKAHLNLYGRDNGGVEFMMTVDHIIPSSRGGPDTLENKQPMCSACNGKKADKLEDV